MKTDSKALGPYGILFGDALITLIFVSKLTLHFTRFFPYHIPPLIYQGGLHPYINVIATVFLAVGFLFNIRKVNPGPRAKLYLAYILIFLTILVVQTFAQMAFVHPDKSIPFQLTGALMAIITVGLFGVVLPLHYPVERFVKVILANTLVIVVLSLLLLPIFGPQMFRGGRFVGITKHIPHMVSISSIAAIFLIARWPLLAHLRRGHALLMAGLTLISFLAVTLTATKAAMGSVFLATLLALFFFGHKSKAQQWGRLFVLASMAVSLFLLTPVVGDALYEVASGERALLGRPAQNGFETRWEEVVRGGDLFFQSPHLGLGILYKFMTSSEGGDVDTYNSFKDPHNIFLSSGVIAGWPFMIVVTIGFVTLLFITYHALRPKNKEFLGPSERAVALFLAVHLPVFLIYHVHLSLGGIADRIYWCVIGYTTLSVAFLHSGQSQRVSSDTSANNIERGTHEKADSAL